ncbi:hypothetical protein DAEQUDRAFT_603275 [Daedalea quercina L-15889]|uniref:Uncharacterized protein n=1 Tax=Daedalea quercina L-15889 TaxID=1314783 RepID=A0A165LM43_9APHY|nr:hypothetical protein DAEQUDRAFT_603275 [Daedalea quercina L-15889]
MGGYERCMCCLLLRAGGVAAPGGRIRADFVFNRGTTEEGRGGGCIYCTQSHTFRRRKQIPLRGSMRLRCLPRRAYEDSLTVEARGRAALDRADMHEARVLAVANTMDLSQCVGPITPSVQAQFPFDVACMHDAHQLPTLHYSAPGEDRPCPSAEGLLPSDCKPSYPPPTWVLALSIEVALGAPCLSRNIWQPCSPPGVTKRS